MASLRPYQSTAASAVRESLAAVDSVVLQMPTGAGKTRTAVELLDGPSPIWFVCHRREIVRQASAALTAAGIAHAVAAPHYKPDYAAPVQVCSIGSMRRRMARYAAPRKIIIDECHHIAARTWSDLVEAQPQAKLIGLTATPMRSDKQGLEHWFDDMVVGPSIASLIRDGFLSPYRLFAPEPPDLESLRLRKGDYDLAEADDVMRDPRIVGDAVAHYQRVAAGKRAIAFTTSIAASLDLVRRMQEAGIPARHVDGTTPVDERDAAVADLASGAISVLSNFGVFTEGFDLPAIDAVILLRPTKSLQLYLQMVGRGLRIAPGKTDAVILDHAGLVFEHGFPDAPIEWSLSAGARKAPRTAVKRPAGMMSCPECNRAHKAAPACPSCGHRYASSAVKAAIEGELAELRATEAERMSEEDAKVEAERIVAEAMNEFVPAAAFGRIIGKAPAAVARMVERGLPTNDAGEIQVSAGLAWVAGMPKVKRAPRKAKVKAKRRWWWW